MKSNSANADLRCREFAFIVTIQALRDDRNSPHAQTQVAQKKVLSHG